MEFATITKQDRKMNTDTNNAKNITKSFIEYLNAKNADKVITTEISINTSLGVKVADVVMSNGHLVAYEIKSELDNTSRLYEQIAGYTEVFDYVYVVYWGRKFSVKTLDLPDYIGAIEAYRDKNNEISFKIIKKAYKNYKLDAKKVAEIMWKSELNYYLRKKSIKTKTSYCKDKLSELFIQHYSKKEANSILRDIFKGRYKRGFDAFLEASEDPLKKLTKNKVDVNYIIYKHNAEIQKRCAIEVI